MEVLYMAVHISFMINRAGFLSIEHYLPWRVCWIGGWDKCQVLFVVTVERPPLARTMRPSQETPRRQL